MYLKSCVVKNLPRKKESKFFDLTFYSLFFFLQDGGDWFANFDFVRNRNYNKEFVLAN